MIHFNKSPVFSKSYCEVITKQAEPLKQALISLKRVEGMKIDLHRKPGNGCEFSKVTLSNLLPLSASAGEHQQLQHLTVKAACTKSGALPP